MLLIDLRTCWIQSIKFISPLKNKTFDQSIDDRVTKAAFERFLEVLSEASRHVPAKLKDKHPDIEWRKILDLGNHLRHAYQKTDYEILWNVYKNELPSLENAIINMLKDVQQ